MVACFVILVVGGRWFTGACWPANLASRVRSRAMRIPFFRTNTTVLPPPPKGTLWPPNAHAHFLGGEKIEIHSQVKRWCTDRLSIPFCHAFLPEWYICYHWWVLETCKAKDFTELTLGVVCFMGLVTQMCDCVLYYSIKKLHSYQNPVFHIVTFLSSTTPEKYCSFHCHRCFFCSRRFCS